tara:strand:+ start:131 stop:667 length:537 start_codon:yes stop_codon:yes gene_type:complete
MTERQERQDNRRPGRTLVINNPEKEYSLQGYDGILNTFKTEKGAHFVIFNTVSNAENALNDLKESGVRVKYSYYKLFVKTSGLDLENLTYDQLKEKVLSKLKSIDSNIEVLYFKLYKRQNKLSGSGDLVLDLKEHLDALVELKNVELDNGSLSLYRYVINRTKRNQRNNNNRRSVNVV